MFVGKSESNSQPNFIDNQIKKKFQFKAISTKLPKIPPRSRALPRIIESRQLRNRNISENQMERRPQNIQLRSQHPEEKHRRRTWRGHFRSVSSRSGARRRRRSRSRGRGGRKRLRSAAERERLEELEVGGKLGFRGLESER